MTEYKVGDVVISPDSPYERLFTVVHVADDEIVIHEVCDEAGAVAFTEFYPYSDIRHARPEEIKANKRSCTHSMTEITVFGDLKRIYECEKCGHKEYEEWVSHD